jgi:hypothetical protein
VSVSGGVRSALGGAKYTQYKPCIAAETVTMGCTAGQIDVRTLPGLIDYGLHLCPTGLPPGTQGVCATYSSGEYRFGKSMAAALVKPPKPKLA